MSVYDLLADYQGDISGFNNSMRDLRSPHDMQPAWTDEQVKQALRGMGLLDNPVKYALSISATSAHVPQQTEPEVIKEEPLPERGIIL